MQQLSALSPRQDDRQVDETWSSTTSVGIDRSITRACVMAGQARPSSATVESVAVHARGTHRTESCSCSRSVHGKPARPAARHHACGRRHRHKISCECGSSDQCKHCSPRSITCSSLVWIQREEDKDARGWLCSIMRRYSPMYMSCRPDHREAWQVEVPTVAVINT